jgi:hypothetical protein
LSLVSDSRKDAGPEPLGVLPYKGNVPKFGKKDFDVNAEQPS